MKRWLWGLPLALGMLPGRAAADSIWDRRYPRYAFPTQDNRARAIGDIITVVVSETTNANENERRALTKATNAAATLAFTGNSSSGTATRTGALNGNLANTSNRTFNGNAQFITGRTFTDRMAAVVVDIMPNGNLVIEGYRSRVVAGEERVLRITGLVRPVDIGLGNVIQSGSVANFRISYLGRGPESRFVNQGYLGRVMNLLWPW